MVQHAVVWNPTAKFQTSSQKWQMQKVQQQQGQGTQVQTQAQAQVQTQGVSAAQQAQSSSTRYQTRQSLKGDYHSGSACCHYERVSKRYFTDLVKGLEKSILLVCVCLNLREHARVSVCVYVCERAFFSYVIVIEVRGTNIRMELYTCVSMSVSCIIYLY